MKLTKKQREFLNQTWDGTEYCSECDMETDFIFNPMESEYITCSHCGKKIHPCSLCDGSWCNPNSNCIETIREVLLRENDKLEDIKKDTDMNYKTETYYRVEMVYGSGSFPDNYETYEAAYDAMCKNYVREITEGYKPTLYKITRYDHTEWNGTKNTMVQPVWS